MRNRHPIFIEDGDKAPGQDDVLRERDAQPPPEEELGGDDICSPEATPPTDDDKSLD